MRITLFRRGRVWSGNYRHDGRRVRTSFDTESRKGAEDLRHGLETQLRNGGAPREEPNTSVADFRK
jgi:hypothetical protein